MTTTNSEKPKARKLTVRQAKLIKNKAAGMPNHEAYVKAGYSATSKRVADSNTRKVLKKPSVQEAMTEALEKYDLTPGRVAGVVNDALSAERTVIIGKEEDAFADQVPDHSIRLKAAGMAAQFMGIGRNSNGDTINNFVQINNDQRGKYGI